LRVRQEFGVTVVFVTHDIDEAVYLADRVIAISKSPGAVTEIVDITLARPRDQITTKADPAFARYREDLLGLVMHREAACASLVLVITARSAERAPGRRPPRGASQ
jgi:NitT/TauT family transport system ATP-binding protein